MSNESAEKNFKPEISIRYATPDDASMLAELGAVAFNQAFLATNNPVHMAEYVGRSFTPAKLLAELTDPDSLFLIAEIESQPVGYAKLLRHAREDSINGARPIELCRFYALQEWLGKGVGPALMDACLKLALDHAHDTIWLGVWEFNPRALRFYSKWGFEVVGRHVFHLGPEAQTDLLMQRSVVSCLTAGALPDESM